VLTVKRMFSACAGLVLLLTYLGGCDSITDRLGRWDNQATATTRVSGLRLVQYISNFHASNGRYPTTLDEMRLDLSDFPAVVGDQIWRYKVFSEGASFELLVRSKPGPHEMREFVYTPLEGRFGIRDI